MATKNSDKAVFWQQHITKYKSSGQSRAEYCQQHGLKVHQLAYHIGRPNRRTSDTSGFAQVLVADAPETSRRTGARLLVGAGMAIELEAGTDPAWVARLVTAIGGRP